MRILERAIGLAVVLAAAIGVATLISASILSADEWPWTRWAVDCRDPDPCDPADEVYKDLLEHASVWLNGLGFGYPRILVKERINPEDPGGPREMFYFAEVSDSKNEGDSETIGVYFPDDKELYIRSDAYFAMGDPGVSGDDPEYGLEESLTFTPVHELFHAVQNNYQDISDDERDWIWEGTADAVLRAFADEFEPELGVKLRARITFDEPLHKPPDDDDAYGTWFFWRNVGRAIDSPSSIAYLDDLLAEDLEDNNGLDGVDRALRPYGGLYKQLPKFFSGLDAQVYFGSLNEIEISLPPGKTEHEKESGSAVKEVAGTAHLLRVKANSTGSGKPLEVEIRFKEDHEDLHLIVDGNRYDIAELGPRNLYRSLIVHGDRRDFDIVVGNVAEETGKSQERSYTLVVTLREVDWCAMTASVTGDIGGSYFGDVAHFSTTGGATIYGAFSNPEMIEGVADWLGGMAEMAGGEGAGEQFEEMKEEMQAGASELPREAFGLSMTNQKLDAEGDEALAFIAGGFSLEASVIGQELAEGFTGSLPLKYLRVVPGPRAESTFDKVPFVWVEGAPGSAQLFITNNDGNLVAGRISGTLYAEGYYKADRSKPVIVVQASFVALEGPTGCLSSLTGLSWQ